jgi:TPP-dependent pyruvate/acetoin dehydrogenase alpha subunit
VAFFGDGAVNNGAFHEGLNMAAIWKLPVLFVCENNRYAYSTPLEKQMAIDDVADRAAAYGFKGYVCSGNDLLAVLDVAEPVLSKMRNGAGPALIECKTYRYHGHSEHDPALYRSKEELLKWESRDPIQRFEFFLEKKGQDVKRLREQMDEKVRAIMQQAVEFAENSPWPEINSVFDDLYATPTAGMLNGKRS